MRLAPGTTTSRPVLVGLAALSAFGVGLLTAGPAAAAPAAPPAEPGASARVVGTPPDPGTSHYLRSLSPTQTTTQITGTMKRLGLADGRAVAGSASPQVVLLQFGAQTNRAGGDGSGTGSELGVRLSATDVRLTYPQVVAAVKGYVSGYAKGHAASSAPVTVAVGTSSAGFAGATYAPADKGRDWADDVVEPAVKAAGRLGITVVGSSDIEADFDAKISEVKTWINAYLGAGPTPFVNNGAASGCPTTAGTTGRSCGRVKVEDSDPVVYNTWTQSDYAAISGTISPSRISVLPQIYFTANATQWENISLTAAGVSGGSPLAFAGVLTSVDACSAPGSGCTSISPDAAWTAMSQALASSPVTAGTDLAASTDLTIS